MKYLKIANEGIIDIRLVALMGGTTKSKDEYKIGQFGTGLKYTLAYLFRNNLDFKIFAGKDEVKIHTETENIRNEDFEIICINGQRTSITTKMGEEWAAWMIVRELWCNALDEGGASRDVVTEFTPVENETHFYIQVDVLFNEVINNWGNYFIHNQEPLCEVDNYKIYGGGNALRIYKQGVLIYQDDQQKALFSYDVKNADINELREFKGHAQWEVSWALSKANEKVAAYFLENITEDVYEGAKDMNYEWYQPKWSDAWVKVLGTAKLIHPQAVKDASAMGITLDTKSLIIVPKCVFAALTKQFDGISSLRIAAKAGEFHEHFDPQIESKINQACAILESCNYIVHPELKFVYGFFEDKRVLARVSMDKKEVLISNTLVQKSLFDILSCLIEENEHFNTGLSDETRAFQQHFINLYTRQLLATNQVEI